MKIRKFRRSNKERVNFGYNCLKYDSCEAIYKSRTNCKANLCPLVQVNCGYQERNKPSDLER